MKLVLKTVINQLLRKTTLLHSSKRLTSYLVNKIRMYEWMKSNDSVLLAEFKRGNFAICMEKQPLIHSLNNNQTDQYKLLQINYECLKKVLPEYKLNFDVKDTALLDVVPMQSTTNDIEEEWTPVFALNIKNASSVGTKKDLAQALGGEFHDFRKVFLGTDTSNAKLLTKMRNIFRWHNSFQNCPRCTARLNFKVSKASAKCPECDAVYYPPVAPVAITLVSTADKKYLLLVRQKHHPKRLYTAISGFSELGESLEDAVLREIAEEVGILVENFQYMGISQSWPFPNNSLMCAYLAYADRSQTISIDRKELVDARWFSREMVASAFENTQNLEESKEEEEEEEEDGPLLISSKGTIVHEMIKFWLSQKAD
ncbi:NAD-capped RNA hydrolase [Trichinella spiralis]|uniref:NAD(+) diphosphatase n=1 Tax=Trichinella spiralis TaxID=6334 RepID=A0ABR3K5J4_TRISP